MNPEPRLHHFAQNITKGHLQDVLEMYELLNLPVTYTPEDDTTWAMVGPKGTRIDIQIVEVDDSPIEDLGQKRNTHTAFISDDPAGVIRKIKEWAESKNIRFREGGWSDIERYFDLPDIFVNFVIEVMHTSIEES